jgi:hypothetical protein
VTTLSASAYERFVGRRVSGFVLVGLCLETGREDCVFPVLPVFAPYQLSVLEIGDEVNVPGFQGCYGLAFTASSAR